MSFQGHLDVLGGAVLERILQTFLRDAVKAQRGVSGNFLRDMAVLKSDRQLGDMLSFSGQRE